MEKTSMNMEENIESLLTYALTWVTGIVFIFLEKENKTVRFHAFQSLFTFLPLTIIGWLLGWIGAPSYNYSGGYYGYGTYNPGIPALIYLSWIIYALTALLWLFLMFKAYQGEKFKLPVVGDLAEKQAGA